MSKNSTRKLEKLRRASKKTRHAMRTNKQRLNEFRFSVEYLGFKIFGQKTTTATTTTTLNRTIYLSHASRRRVSVCVCDWNEKTWDSGMLVTLCVSTAKVFAFIHCDDCRCCQCVRKEEEKFYAENPCTKTTTCVTTWSGAWNAAEKDVRVFLAREIQSTALANSQQLRKFISSRCSVAVKP